MNNLHIARRAVSKPPKLFLASTEIFVTVSAHTSHHGKTTLTRPVVPEGSNAWPGCVDYAIEDLHTNVVLAYPIVFMIRTGI